uniref:Putative transposase n=2 Tax=Actinomycetes TaxID=1760 RepID=B6EUK8_9MICO|nr:putative transposase [Terrabacter sp. YK3]
MSVLTKAPLRGCARGLLPPRACPPEGRMKKSDREIMEILEAFDATQSAHSAAGLAGVDPKTVRRYVAARDQGRPVTGPGRRARMIDEHMGKIEEWVERGNGKVRADVIHGRLVGLGFAGTERTTRRAVAQVKAAWRAGHRRGYRPWITEPGLWLQFDWGEGSRVPGPDGKPRRTWLFCAWLAWSRFRVVIPVWDQTLPTLTACLDAALRRLGGVPSCASPPIGAVAGVERGQVHLLDRVEHEPGQMVLLEPLGQRRRHQEHLITLHSQEVVTHVHLQNPYLPRDSPETRPEGPEDAPRVYATRSSGSPG